MSTKPSPIEQRLKWYERALRLSQKAASESLDEVCRYLMDEVIAAAEAQQGFLFLKDKSQKFHYAFGRARGGLEVPKDHAGYSESILDKAVEMDVPLIIDDATMHPEFRQAHSVIYQKLKSVLALPIHFEGKVIALIYLENREERAYFSRDLLEVLSLFSAQASILLYSRMEKSPIKASPIKLNEQLQSLSPKMQKIYEVLPQMAAAPSNILVLGETGTGKEVTASWIHRHSKRSAGPFVALNCSAIPEGLLESELFGHKEGAFTGAVADRDGLIKKANGGTLFLDEVGDLPLQMQAKLLRVLQEHTFIPVGSTEQETSHFRLIAATHHPLEERVTQGLFRQDLYYRMNTIVIQLPALRDRIEDLPTLAELFIAESCEIAGKSKMTLTENGKALLSQYPWPGNIRELQNVIQRAVVMTNETRLDASHFSFLRDKPEEIALPTLNEAKEEFIQNYIKKAILVHGGSKSKAAKALGVDPKTLYRHLIKDG